MTYQIDYSSLEDGSYQFDFQVDDRLFSRFENTEIRNAELEVSAEILKKSDEISLHLKGKGSIELQCDRCLDFFLHEINTDNDVQIHLAEETNFDTDEDFVCFDRSAEKLDISYFIYEMVILSLPIRRVHPEGEDGNSMCNPDVVKYITGESAITDLDGDVIDEAEADENWKEDLKNLLNN